MKAGSVAVGIVDPGHWSACFGMSLNRLYLADASKGGSQRIIPNGTQIRTRASAGGLVSARNGTARRFLDETDCEWLLLIDTDMGFDQDIADRLVESADRYDRPIVGGLCFALRRLGTDERFAEKYFVIPTLYEFCETDTEVGFRTMPDYERDAMVKVAATGAAALLIHRRALHNIREKCGTWFDPITHPKGPTTFSEDLSFCVRASLCDLPVFVNTAVKTCHDKGGVFLDEETFDHQAIETEA